MFGFKQAYTLRTHVLHGIGRYLALASRRLRRGEVEKRLSVRPALS